MISLASHGKRTVFEAVRFYAWLHFCDCDSQSFQVIS